MGTFFDGFERRRSLAPQRTPCDLDSALLNRARALTHKMDPKKVSSVFPSPVAGRTTSAAAAEPQYSCEFGSSKYYALSCGLTHTMVTPLDLVKCRLQVNKEKYKTLGNGFKLTVQESGASGLFLGWAPTAIGYSMQGICKFGFYEFFKNIYSGILGE